MKELTKGRWTTVRMLWKVRELLRFYKTIWHFKSYGEAIKDMYDKAIAYRELADLDVKKELGQ